MGSKIELSLIRTNIKNMLLVSYDYKLRCVDDMFSKPFKSYLGEDAVYNFVKSTNGWGTKSPYQFFRCNFYNRRN